MIDAAMFGPAAYYQQMACAQPSYSSWHSHSASAGAEVRKASSSRTMELRRAVEVAALEQKLRDTKQRHAQELSLLMEASDACCGGLSFSCAPQVSTHSTSSASGPVLATRRRCPGSGAPALRLWVEDCAAMDGARVHAMDEASGLRTFTDVPDRTLSAMLAGYRRAETSHGVDDTDEVDICLKVLLDDTYVHGPTPDGFFELSLPNIASLTAAAAMAAVQLAADSKYEGQCFSSFCGGAVAAPPFATPPSSPHPQAGAWVHAAAAGVNTATVAAVAAARARQLAGAACRSPQGLLAGRQTLAQLTSLDCTGEVAPSKPPQRQATARPQSACRPQSARAAGRDSLPLSATAPPGCTVAEPTAGSSGTTPRRRRTRPTSAKALKHRRVVDDGVDSIIYEDVEEEVEVRPVSLRVGRGAGSRPTSAGSRSRLRSTSAEDAVPRVRSRNADEVSARITPRPPLERPPPGRPDRGRPQAQSATWLRSPGGDVRQPGDGSAAHPTALLPPPPPLLASGGRTMQGVHEGGPSITVPRLGVGPRPSSPPAPPKCSLTDASQREPSVDSGVLCAFADASQREPSVDSGLIYSEASAESEVICRESSTIPPTGLIYSAESAESEVICREAFTTPLCISASQAATLVTCRESE